MSTTGDFAATEGTGKKAATFTFTEDSETKFLQRVPIAGSDGSDISGTTADAAYGGSGAGSWTAIFKWIGASLVSLLAKFPTLGQKASSGSVSVVLASDNIASVVGPGSYETVAASASAQVLGATGATGDFLSHLLIVPASTSPGSVQIQDGAGSLVTVFAGGASSVSNLVAFAVPLGLKSIAGAWKVTTGANVSVIGVGKFT